MNDEELGNNPYDFSTNSSNVNEYNPNQEEGFEEGSISLPKDNKNIETIQTDTNDELNGEIEEENHTFSTPSFMESSSDTETIDESKETNNLTPQTKDEGNTYDEDEDIKWKKVSATEAAKKNKTKPKILNKKLLVSLIIFAFLTIFIVMYLSPQDKKKQEESSKPTVENVPRTDYSSIAKRRTEKNQNNNNDDYSENNDNDYEKENNSSEDKTKPEVEIPPVIKETDKEPYTENNINHNTGHGNGSSSSTTEIPDTRNDSLQAKSIRGIKGLSSTQASYSTDYQQTIAQNTQNNYSSSSFNLPSKQEFMNNMLNPYTQAAMNNNDYAMQNDRTGKENFYNNGRNSDNVGQGQFLPLNTIWQGTIFEAILTSEINTDLPGEITARVAKNIYSSQDGQYLLIPQNSVLFGTYNSSISYSQSRVQVAWHKLIRPDGYEIQLGNMNGTDEKGASGLKGFVNDHPLSYLKAIGLMSVFSIINSEFDSMLTTAEKSNNATSPYVQNILANTQNVTVTLGEKLIDRAMNVQPTIKIKAGTKVNIVANQTLSLPPCENIPVTQPYRKY